MSNRLSTALAFSLLLLVAAPGCEPVDNSGGDAPDGIALSYLVDAEPSLYCGAMDAAAFIDDGDDAEAWLAACNDDGFARDLIDDKLDELNEGESLIAVSAQLGGCTQDFNVHGVYLDSNTLNVWILKQDTSFGRDNVACTADIGEGHALVIVDDAEEATSIQVHVSSYNPDLPGGPVVPAENQNSAQ